MAICELNMTYILFTPKISTPLHLQILHPLVINYDRSLTISMKAIVNIWLYLNVYHHIHKQIGKCVLLRSIVSPSAHSGGKSWQKVGTGNFEVSSLPAASLISLDMFRYCNEEYPCMVISNILHSNLSLTMGLKREKV